MHEQEQQLENLTNNGGEVMEQKYCGIEKVVQVSHFFTKLNKRKSLIDPKLKSVVNNF